MRTLRQFGFLRIVVFFVTFSLAWMEVMPAYSAVRAMQIRQDEWAAALAKRTYLPPGLTQTPSAALRKKIAARQAAAVHPRPDCRLLTRKEMTHLMGRGPYRNPYFSGAPMPWQRAFHDVNLVNGNLFKSFTDIQVAPARGAGLVLQRTYNSQDSRIGPFGVGWTHAYDIRIQESGNVAAETQGSASQQAALTQVNMAPRTDFFGHKHNYHRDADGLYTPPAYCFDTMNSDYQQTLASGPVQVMDDTQKGEDGTVKHFTNVLTNADGSLGNERACDFIQDRHGNTTTLAYGLTVTNADGSTRKLLTSVTDPSGRQLTFQWTNLSGSTTQPAWRVTQVTGPLYSVSYAYFTNTSDPNAANDLYNLQSVTLDSGTGAHLNRTTSYKYTQFSGNLGTENALLFSITDPLSETVSYTYLIPAEDGNVNDRYDADWVCVYGITEPAGVDSSGTPRVQHWTWDEGQGIEYNDLQSVAAVHNDAGLGFDYYYRYDVPINTGIPGAAFEDDFFPYVGPDQNDSNFGANYFVWYDISGNMIIHELRDSGYSENLYPSGISQSLGGDLDNEEDYTYGTHGNQLTHATYGFSGQDISTYFNGDKYFAKSGMTDMNGHTSIMDYYTSSDPNPGNRGGVKFVRDARYATTGAQYYYTYNQYGQKATETNLNGLVTQYTYVDQWGNLTQVVQDPGGLNRTTTMTYDVAGHVLTSTDPNGHTSTFTYNVLGQPLTVTTASVAAAPGETISYVYDVNGRTHSVTDHRGTTIIAYETGSDRVSSVTDPVTGPVSYTYMLSGERASMTLPNHKTWTYTYWPGYIPNAYNITFTTQRSDDAASIGLSLKGITDDAGRTVSYNTNAQGALQATLSDQTFDVHGNLVTYADTSIINDIGVHGNSYDTNTWIYSTHQRVAATSTYWDVVNGNQTTPTQLSRNDYTYDLVGNRLTNAIATPGTVVDSHGNPVTTARTESYSYDELNRLSAVNYGDGETQSYGFDAMGNRLVKMDATASGTVTTNSAYDLANRLTSVNASSYANDANGNTLTGGGRTMTWDSQNRMVSCAYNGNTLTFDYGSDGLRRSETLTSGGQSVTTYYVYDGQSLVMEETKNAQGVLTPSASYLNGPRGPEYKKDETTGLVKWYLYDGLGSVIGEVDPSGNVTYSAKYDVYGGVRGTSGSATTAQGFVGGLGHLSEATTGLIYMRARYYDPNTGRFASQDSSMQGINWFEYGCDNPVNTVDATGMNTISITSVNLMVDGLTAGFLFTAIAIWYAGQRNYAAAFAYTNLAAISFGVASMGYCGAGGSPNMAWIQFITCAAAGGGCAAIMVALDGEAGANTPGVVGTTITATIAYSLLVLGDCLSIGADA